MTRGNHQAAHSPAQQSKNFDGTNTLAEPGDPSKLDKLGRVEHLAELMFGLSDECLNLARFEDEPPKRGALVQAGLSTANGWLRMSDLHEKLTAMKGKDGEK